MQTIIAMLTLSLNSRHSQSVSDRQETVVFTTVCDAGDWSNSLFTNMHIPHVLD